MLAAWPKSCILKLHGILCVIDESEKPLLKELCHATIKHEEAVINSVFLCLEFLYKLFQVLSGFSWPSGCQFEVEVICSSQLPS